LPKRDAVAFSMRIWLSEKEARALRGWAIAKGNPTLADRLHRGVGYGNSKMPWDWRWKMRNPLLLQCDYCDRWAAYRKHRRAKKDWVKVEGQWVHRWCVDNWEQDGDEFRMLRYRALRQEEQTTALFGNESLLTLYRGILVRISEPEKPAIAFDESAGPGIFDEDELWIESEFGNRRVTQLIDSMSEEERQHLVGAAFEDYFGAYNVLLAWVGAVPEKYDQREVLDDIKCHSFVVTDLRRSLRQRLDPTLASQL
jgi:hypothetical protein